MAYSRDIPLRLVIFERVFEYILFISNRVHSAGHDPEGNNGRLAKHNKIVLW